MLAHPLGVGALALAWLVLRTGRKPSRLAYPCQQAALGSVSAAWALALAPAARRAGRWLRTRRAPLTAVATMAAALLLGGLRDSCTGQARARAAAASYVARVFDVGHAAGMAGDHHLGVDALLQGMGANGLKIYRSAVTGALAGPDGLVGPDDVVLLKVNQQWSERGGTSTDVLQGLIASLLEHPDGFHGEIVVVENGQGLGSFDWPASNAQDVTKSTSTVVGHFASQGLPVSECLWDSLMNRSVGEYSSGDLANGYVLGPWADDVQMRVSYPKFRTPGGHFVSLQQGVWDSVTAMYDRGRLKLITLPVLKCHAAYGVTGAVKIHLGTMTTGLDTNAHDAVAYGGIGRFLAQVRMPDLNLLDCTYVLADPNQGPACDYEMATRVDHLAASQDPVALDLWATAHILVPAILANGFTAYPHQDPADTASTFRSYLDRTAAQLAAGGVAVTNDPARIQAFEFDTDSVPVAPAPGAAAPHPNPFVAATAIPFALPRGGAVRLEIYDAGGRLRRTLAATAPAGAARELTWDGRDDAGRRVEPGTYFYRVRAAGEARSGLVTLLR